MRIPGHTSAENLPLDLDSAAPGEYDETWFEQNLMRIDLAFRHMFEAQGGMNHKWRITYLHIFAMIEDPC